MGPDREFAVLLLINSLTSHLNPIPGSMRSALFDDPELPERRISRPAGQESRTAGTADRSEVLPDPGTD